MQRSLGGGHQPERRVPPGVLCEWHLHAQGREARGVHPQPGVQEGGRAHREKEENQGEKNQVKEPNELNILKYEKEKKNENEKEKESFSNLNNNNIYENYNGNFLKNLLPINKNLAISNSIKNVNLNVY